MMVISSSFMRATRPSINLYIDLAVSELSKGMTGFGIE